MTAPATPPPVPPGPPPLDYVPTYGVRSNVPALVALVCGVLLCVPFLSGLAALVFGRQGLSRADELHGAGRRMAQAGIVLGMVNLVISFVVLAASFPAMGRARQRAQEIQCASNLRQVATAMIMYASSNQNALPPDLDALVPFFGSAQSAAAVCTCPGAKVHGVPPATVGRAITSSYIYVPPGVQRLNQIRSPATTVAVYEPLADHGGRDANVLFWDGHVELLQGAAAQATVARLQAQQAAGAATRPSPAGAPTPDEGGNP
jgi:prepilin-type processing-associated H-X9-DG protein